MYIVLVRTGTRTVRVADTVLVLQFDSYSLNGRTGTGSVQKYPYVPVLVSVSTGVKIDNLATVLVLYSVRAPDRKALL